MKKLLYVFLFFIIPIFAQAQNLDIKGMVTESDSGYPAVGVTVLVKGTNNGVSTDFDGNYALNGVPKDGVLLFQSLGYKPLEVAVDSRTTINVSLEPDVEAIEEIVIVGYGTQKKKEVTGAVAVIGAETIEELNPTRVEQALQGQVAGVNITSQSGSPGAGLDIRIRGVSSNGNNAPLILVDGAVIEDLSVINPSDIESINVLKDATAGIYGVRAANGVILIKTKSGRKEMPLTFDYETYGGFQQTTRKLPTLNATEYAALVNEAYANNGEGPVFTDLSSLGKGTDWQDEVFQDAFLFNHALTLRGGGKKSTYSVGGSYLSQDGIVGGDKSNFTRYTGRLNYTYQIVDNLKLNTSVLYTGTDRKTLPENTIGSVLYNAINMAPSIPVYNSDGTFSGAEGLATEVVNPLAQMANTFNDTHVDKFSGVFGLNYEFLNHFKATANYQWNYAEVKYDAFFPIQDYGIIGVSDKVFDRATIAETDTKNIFRDYTFDAFLNYNQRFNEVHNFDITLGTSVFKTTGDTYGTIYSDVDGSGTYDEAVDREIVDVRENGGDKFDERLLSYFGRVQYNFDEKYLFSATLRRDGSTKFGPSNKFGYFPTVSAGWVVSDENFMENIDWLDSFKVRGSYGIIGNDKIPGNRYVSLLTGEGEYVFNNTIFQGVAIGGISNPEIKWEEQKTFDVGFDVKFANNKVDVVFDYFRKTTENLLVQVGVAGVVGSSAPGSSAPFVNAGTVENNGFEFAIGYKDNIGEDFSFDINYNITQLENKVTYVGNDVGYISGGSFGIGQDPPARMQEGYTMGYYYGYQTNGVFQNQTEVDVHPDQSSLGAAAQPGDIRFVDVNGDNVINSEDRTNLGDPIADITMGLNLSFEYKSFDLQTYIFASLGNEIVRNYERNHPLTNRTNYELGRWTGEGTSNTAPRVTTGATSNLVFSDFYVEDGSFARMQNLQLGYTFADSLNELTGLDKCRIYFSASNVFTVSKYRGFDPTASTGAAIGGGFDQGFYPAARTFLLGLNVKF